MYIIENANILKDKQLTSSSMLIMGDKITKIQSHFTHYRLMKMNIEPYIMTPTFVLLCSNIPHRTFLELKNYLINQLLLKGCTTLVTYANVTFENEIKQKVKEVKTALMSSPIDFIIGLKIPVRLLTPSFIRNCKKEKIPAIFVELKTSEELENIPWGWIKEAMFPFNSPLIPLISFPDKKEAKTVLSKWNSIMVKEKIPSIYEELKENQPLSKKNLNKIGLYPQKASLMNSTELSYNLYFKEREIKNVDEVDLFHYHGDRLVVTVHRGKVVRAGENVLFNPGYGEHVKVRTPSYFSL